MADSKTFGVARARPKILVTSSLRRSRLNRHILDGLLEAVRRSDNALEVEFLAPERVVESKTASAAQLLLYIGSSLSEASPLSTIAAFARSHEAPSVFWATDDPYEFDTRYRAAGFDVYFSNDRNAAEHFLDRSHVYHLPLAASNSDFRAIGSLASRELGLFFCGYPYANRKMIIADLLEEPDLSVQDLVVAGPGWEMPRLHATPGDLTHDSLLDLYSASVFVLNLGRNYSLANSQHLVATTPGPRTFECALAGTPQFYFKGSLEIEDYYENEKEIVIVESVAEIVHRLAWYRRNESAWAALAQAGQQRTLREHLYLHRIQTLFATLERIGLIDAGVKGSTAAKFTFAAAG